jgi:hypothetical protein
VVVTSGRRAATIRVVITVAEYWFLRIENREK